MNAERTKIVQMQEDNGWIGVTDAARKMGCHFSTVYRFVKSGKWKSQKAGNRVFVRIADCAEYVGPSLAAVLGWSPTTSAQVVEPTLE